MPLGRRQWNHYSDAGSSDSVQLSETRRVAGSRSRRRQFRFSDAQIHAADHDQQVVGAMTAWRLA
jgi:hypothetical protein